jgi:RNA polymerase sigma-70 factor (ECF subfamily)
MERSSTETTQRWPELEVERDWLFRQALWRLRDRDAAEDIAQEAWIAAWQSRGTWNGKGKLRSWLAGILRHKVLDHLRAKYRTGISAETELEPQEEGLEVFDSNGMWKEPVATWGDPAEALESGAFWTVLETCARVMPESQYRVFVMRELDEIETREICQTLGISHENCHVLLHRARMKLRLCLDKKWRRAA